MDARERVMPRMYGARSLFQANSIDISKKGSQRVSSIIFLLLPKRKRARECVEGFIFAKRAGPFGGGPFFFSRQEQTPSVEITLLEFIKIAKGLIFD